VWFIRFIEVPFSHTFDEQIGGQLKTGFIITAAYEDFNNEPDAIADGIPSYWATRAVKPMNRSFEKG
jgi:hypothetical protein